MAALDKIDHIDYIAKSAFIDTLTTDEIAYYRQESNNDDVYAAEAIFSEINTSVLLYETKMASQLGLPQAEDDVTRRTSMHYALENLESHLARFFEPTRAHAITCDFMDKVTDFVRDRLVAAKSTDAKAIDPTPEERVADLHRRVNVHREQYTGFPDIS